MIHELYPNAVTIAEGKINKSILLLPFNIIGYYKFNNIINI